MGKRRQSGWATAAWVAVASLSGAAGAQAGELPAPPRLVLADAPVETFHDSDLSRCGATKVHIDSPVRLFQDQRGTVHMFVSDPSGRGWQWTGWVGAFNDYPNTATLDCAPVMDGYVGNDDVSAFDQKTFIQALHFDLAGQRVHAYGHEDYFGTRLSDPDCHKSGTADGKPQCWYSAIVAWGADTSGPGAHLDFNKSAAAPDHGAIYPHVAYPGDANTPLAGWIGYGTPSNIVRGFGADGAPDGYYYMFAYTSSGYGEQDKGVCLFRSDDPTDRTRWRAWNGDAVQPGFTQAMGNPYTTQTAPCAVVNPGTFNSYVRSVAWHAPSRHYVAVFRDSAGVRYATSPDLLTWNSSQPLLDGSSSQINYPVIVDLEAGFPRVAGDDPNFDSIYDMGKIYLFFRTSVVSGHTRINRQRIEVANYHPEPQR